MGAYIAVGSLEKLADKSIQAIETWNDKGEALTTATCRQLLNDEEPDKDTRPIMLLAGAILAAARQPHRYDELNRKVESCLDQSIAASKVWEE